MYVITNSDTWNRYLEYDDWIPHTRNEKGFVSGFEKKTKTGKLLYIDMYKKNNQNYIDSNIPTIYYPTKKTTRTYFNRLVFPMNSPYLKLAFKIPPGYASPSTGTIFDLETTGTDATSKAITAGFVANNLVEIYQCHLLHYLNEFQKIIKNLVLGRPLPIIGYSIIFEQKFCNYGRQMKELKNTPYFFPTYDTAGGLYYDLLEIDYSYNDNAYRKKLIKCIRSPMNDNSGAACPHLWSKYILTMNTIYLFEIVWHNILDVLREAYLYHLKHVLKTYYYLIHYNVTIYVANF